jgi:hypothetical protein
MMLLMTYGRPAIMKVKINTIDAGTYFALPFAPDRRVCKDGMNSYILMWDTKSCGGRLVHLTFFNFARTTENLSWDPASLEPGTVCMKDAQITRSPLNVNTYKL